MPKKTETVVEVAPPCDHQFIDTTWQDGDRAWMIQTRCGKCGWQSDPTPLHQAIQRVITQDVRRVIAPADFTRF